MPLELLAQVGFYGFSGIGSEAMVLDEPIGHLLTGAVTDEPGNRICPFVAA